MPDLHHTIPAPVQVLMLSVSVRSETYRSYTTVVPSRADGQLDWFDIGSATITAMDNAAEACRARGLPAPKVAACTWRGGAVIPPIDSDEHLRELAGL